MTTKTVHDLETRVFKQKNIVLRRLVNYKAWDNPDKMELVVAKQLYHTKNERYIQLLVDHIYSRLSLHQKNQDEDKILSVCYELEKNGQIVLPRMIHYMDKETQTQTLELALHKWMDDHVWSIILQ